MQRITLAESAGFCFGVNRAVKLLEELVKKNQNVFTLGPIIHNPQVIKYFENKGVRIIDSPDECKEGDLIVVRTHGIPKDMMEKVKSISPNYCNATCPFVTKIHKIVSENSLKENVTLIAGDKSHPEVIGIRSYCNGRSFVFNSEKELDKISLLFENIANSTQDIMNGFDIKDVKALLSASSDGKIDEEKLVKAYSKVMLDKSDETVDVN